jgi:hypothetical protein
MRLALKQYCGMNCEIENCMDLNFFVSILLFKIHMDLV